MTKVVPLNDFMNRIVIRTGPCRTKTQRSSYEQPIVSEDYSYMLKEYLVCDVTEGLVYFKDSKGEVLVLDRGRFDDGQWELSKKQEIKKQLIPTEEKFYEHTSW